ncbi:MAG: tetratricopeptide repeat protein [Candidatus Delongbacteria bacterium]|nr:tetratricopeptide repeat protein [Candidatus Delongbacteria bacterium]
MKSRLLILIVLAAFFSIISCGPSSQTVREDSVKEEVSKTAENKEPAQKKVLDEKDKYEINKLSSFAQSKKQQKKFRDMIEYINEIMNIDPDFEYAKDILLFWRGNGYEELGLRDSAVVDYERFSEMKPDHSQVLLQLDYIYVTEGKIDEAIDVARRMIDIDSEDKSLLKKLGKYYYQKAEDLKAEDPNDPEIEEYALLAIESFEDYIESNPEDEEISNLLTFLTSKFLDREAFKARLEENLKVNPDDSKTIERLAAIYYDEGNTEKAAGLLEKLLEKFPDDLKAIRRLIRIYRNDVDKAIAYNKRAMKLDEGNETYNINLARLYSEKKRFADARSECLKALKKNSKNVNAYRVWASIYSESIAACNVNIEYQDKLVFIIAYGLYEKAGDPRRLHAMKESGQVPSKSDYFINRSTVRPSRECYNWINPEWEEVKYIDAFLKTL